MKDFISTITDTISYIKRDKVNVILLLIPLLIGIVVYFAAGTLIYGSLYKLGMGYMTAWITSGTMGTIIAYLAKILFSILFYFLINFTFVLVVTVIASPFNDLLSSRIEKLYKEQEVEGIGTAFKNIFSKIVFVLFNELKKITFIIILTIASFILGYVPFLLPLSVVISGLLLAVEFLDYSWSRHDLAFSDCFKELKRNFIVYTISGLCFLVLVTIPVINLFVPALATSFFTLMYLKKNLK